MSKGLVLYPKFKAFYPGTSIPLVGGKLYVCVAGSTGVGTLKDSYANASTGTANANPVILDANGEADVWYDNYAKLVLTTALDVAVWSEDNILGGLSSAVITSVAQTITVQHTFAPTSAEAPFILDTNARDQMVTGLYAERSNTALPGVVGLKIVPNNTYPLKAIDITCDVAIAMDADGNVIRGRSVSVTPNLMSAGANGLRAGLSYADSTGYYAYLLCNPATGVWAGYFDTLSALITLPVGYTHWVGPLWWSYSDAGWGGVFTVYQSGKVARYLAPREVLHEGSAAVSTKIDLVTYVPKGIEILYGKVLNVTTDGIVLLDNLNFGTAYQNAEINEWFVGGTNAQYVLHCLTSDQQMYYYAASGGPYTMNVAGWRWR